VPDDQLKITREITAGLGFEAIRLESLKPRYASEYLNIGDRYIINDVEEGRNHTTAKYKRLLLLPMSWAGIRDDEIVPCDRSDLGIPCKVWTIPLPATCATLLRLSAKENLGSSFRSSLRWKLTSAIAYGLFDMSYEGDYQEHPDPDEPFSAEEQAEMDSAIVQIRGWAWRSDEEWLREALIQAVTGEITYDDLPHS
jgi:hypothetical protein